MATPARVRDLIEEHSTNTVAITDMTSQSHKPWTGSYRPISRLRVHTVTREDGAVIANFDAAFLPAYADDNLRLDEPAYPPNKRHYRLYSEQDGATWFHNEVSNIVLPAFGGCPLLVQNGEPPPRHGSGNTSKLVDVAYTATYRQERTHLAIGEFKRNLIVYKHWQEGSLVGTQRSFSKELRGYAVIYNCPHVFCFDHKYFLMLQFRANTRADMGDCDVDCWILPRDNPNGTSIRVAMYRLLVQGFRRLQGQYVAASPFNADIREMFSGQPFFRIDGQFTANPHGMRRLLDVETGAFFWVDADGNCLLDDNEEQIWDTTAVWSIDGQY